MTAAEDRFKRLRAVLGEGAVGLVHGQLPPSEKDAAMARFVAGDTKVLVATTVIEVGVERSQRQHHGDRAGRAFSAWHSCTNCADGSGVALRHRPAY